MPIFAAEYTLEIKWHSPLNSSFPAWPSCHACLWRSCRRCRCRRQTYASWRPAWWYEIYDDQKNIIGEGGLDLIMTGVGFIPGYGWAISSAYFLGKSALENNNLDFWNEYKTHIKWWNFIIWCTMCLFLNMVDTSKRKDVKEKREAPIPIGSQ